MRPNIWHLLVVYGFVVSCAYIGADGGTAAVVALCLAVGWYFGYLHGTGLFLK